jgi:SAM-dependent methyltransferase
MDLKEQDLLGQDIRTHWYYRSKCAALLRLIGDRPVCGILDVGAGSGFFSRELLARTSAREALCVDTGYERDRDETVSGKPLRFRRSCGAVDADLVLLMDVLEHVKDDRGLLAEYVAKMAAGTRVVITVPAFRFLWSGHDEFLGHERRYAVGEVEALVRAAGLEVVTAAYFFGLVFPLAAVRRLVSRAADGTRPRSDLSPLGPVMNSLLSAACRLELPLLKWNRLAGLSVCCLARKP